MLVTVEQLASRLNDPDWVLFDCRHDLMDHTKGERLYRESHLPGAHFARVEHDLAGLKSGVNGRHPLPEPHAFADFLARHGATDSSTIVAYDDTGGMYAARLWWLARWIGHRRAAVLDGGFSRWKASGQPLSTEVTTLRAGNIRAVADNTKLWTTAQVLSHLHDPKVAVVDARTADRYRGENETIDPVAGRIPGSLNRFFKANLREDGTFRPAEELKREISSLIGNAKPANVIHQCGSGIAACANLLAMEYAGLPGSKLYAGSWSEWIADPSRPVAKGA